MEQIYHYLIKVLSEGGEWYTNAIIENSYDAIAVAKFYREQLGYSVQLWHKEKDVSHLIDSAKNF